MTIAAESVSLCVCVCVWSEIESQYKSSVKRVTVKHGWSDESMDRYIAGLLRLELSISYYGLAEARSNVA